VKKRSLLGTTLIVLPMQIVFRAGEALLPILLAYWFGRSGPMDVYFFAWAVFALAGSLVFSAFHDSPLVPILAEERLARPKGVPRLLGSLLAHTWLFGGALAVAVGVVALGWFGLRYEGPDLTLAAAMVVPFTLFLVAMATRTFFSTLLAVEHHFFVQPVASGLGMLANFAVLWGGHARFGVPLVPVAALAGELVAVGLLSWFALRALGIKIRLTLERTPELVRFAKLAAAQVGGGAITRVNPVVDQMMAGFAGVVGAGTMLRYSGDVALLPTSLVQAALLPVLLSHLADDFARRDLVHFRQTVVRALAAVSGVLVVATAVLWIVRGPLLRFVFLRGEMDEGGVDRMIALLPYHLVGLAPFGGLLVLARAHVALKNSSIMVSMGLLNAGSNLVFNVVFLRLLGLEGIALATSAVHLAVAIVFWLRLERRLVAVHALPKEAT
jgi:putative peptidoglycan lipid II flippase